MKLLSFKFQQNHTIIENFDFFEGGGEKGGPHLYILNSIIIGEQMEMFCFIIQPNCTINEELDFRKGGGRGASIYKL